MELELKERMGLLFVSFSQREKKMGGQVEFNGSFQVANQFSYSEQRES